jgi:tetratricopeptide (TPR) repeat protein
VRGSESSSSFTTPEEDRMGKKRKRQGTGSGAAARRAGEVSRAAATVESLVEVPGLGKAISILFFVIWSVLIVLGMTAALDLQWIRSVSETGRAVEADSMKEYGDEALKAGRPLDAISNYLSALEINADDGAVLANMGVAYRKLGKSELAMSTFARALGDDVHNSQPSFSRLQMAELHEEAGRLDAAMVQYRKAAKTAPLPFYAWREIGRILVQRQDYADAIRPLELALEHRLDLEEQYRSMLLEIMAKDFNTEEIREAVELQLETDLAEADLDRYDPVSFERVLSRDRDLSRIHNYLGVARGYQGDLERAAYHFEECLKIWSGAKGAADNLRQIRERLDAAQGP